MARPILLVYGAYGRSGRLIVGEALAQGGFDIVAGGRDAARLAALARRQPEVAVRVVAVDNEAGLVDALVGVDVVVNAAGPFRATAMPILRACMQSGCDYVDINGEIDVYRSTYEQFAAANDGRTSAVCAAGYTSAASDLLASAAIATLNCRRLSSVQVDYAQVTALSGASVATAWRMLRLPVVVSKEPFGDPSDESWTKTLVGQPVGRLERILTFQSPPHDRGRPPTVRRALGTAVSLLDTPVLWQTFSAANLEVARVASYIEMPGWQRLAYQVGALACWLGSSASAQRAAKFGGSADAGRIPHSIALGVDGELDEPLIRWQLDVDDVHDFTAQVAVAIARAITSGKPPRRGWLTPSASLGAASTPAADVLARFRGCRVHTQPT